MATGLQQSLQSLLRRLEDSLMQMESSLYQSGVKVHTLLSYRVPQVTVLEKHQLPQSHGRSNNKLMLTETFCASGSDDCFC